MGGVIHEFAISDKVPTRTEMQTMTATSTPLCALTPAALPSIGEGATCPPQVSCQPCATSVADGTCVPCPKSTLASSTDSLSRLTDAQTTSTRATPVDATTPTTTTTSEGVSIAVLIIVLIAALLVGTIAGILIAKKLWHKRSSSPSPPPSHSVATQMQSTPAVSQSISSARTVDSNDVYSEIKLGRPDDGYSVIPTPT
jgi:uncharacterized protein YneF (UPF0154 family)